VIFRIFLSAAIARQKKPQSTQRIGLESLSVAEDYFLTSAYLRRNDGKPFILCGLCGSIVFNA